MISYIDGWWNRCMSHKLTFHLPLHLTPLLCWCFLLRNIVLKNILKKKKKRVPLRKSSAKIIYRTILLHTISISIANHNQKDLIKEDPLTSRITSIVISTAATLLSFFCYLYHFWSAGCNKLRTKKLCDHFFIYHFLPLFLSCSKAYFFISPLRSVKVHERWFLQ